MKIVVFTSKSCPKCPAAKAVAEEVATESGCGIEIVDIEKELFRALQNQIASVPSVLIESDSNTELFCVGEVPDKAALRNAIEKAREDVNIL